MSAITGIGDSLTTVLSASTSSSRGTATRTRSAPASATLWICSIVAGRLAVSVLVIVWTGTGAAPPIGTSLTHIWRLEATCQGYLRPAARRCGRVNNGRVGNGYGFRGVEPCVHEAGSVGLHLRRFWLRP